MPKKKVLIIEDDKNISSSLKKTLELEGFAVEAASDGDSGLGMLKTASYDIIMLDMKLPRTDGYSVFIEAAAIQKAARIIVMSGMTNEFRRLFSAEDMKRIFLWLDKPFDIEYLVKKLKASG